MEEIVIQINGGIMINVDVNVNKCCVNEKDYLWITATCNCENGKYQVSILDDSEITCDEIIESYDDEIFIFYLHFYQY